MFNPIFVGEAQRGVRSSAAETAAATVNSIARFPCSWSLRQFVEIFDKRHHCAVESLYLRVGRLDDVILVGRVRAAAVTEAEMSGRQFERLAGENISWI